VVAGFVVAALARDEATPAAITDTNHGNVKVAKGDMKRILNAVDAKTSAVSNDELVAEGRRLFRDAARYEEGESCQGCHAEGSGSRKLGIMLHDKQAPAAGALARIPDDFDGPRDPPSLSGLDKTPPFFWNGDLNRLDEALTRPVLGHFREFVPGGRAPAAGDPDCAPAGDGSRSQACLDRAAGFAAALVAYVKTLDPPSTAFDQGTMSAAALRGEKIFQGKGGCIECHGGPLFTDNLVHNTGVPQVKMPNDASRTSLDLGAPPPPEPPECANNSPACEHPPAPQLPTAQCPAANQVVLGVCSAFVNTPQMRDLKNTPPYMHNGAFETLKEVVEFYNSKSIVSPLNLQPDEVNDLVAYLESL
jgi:cytochrome c peroxidase